MRKQELIHLHGLSHELRSWVTARHTVDGEFEAYDAHGVKPSEIHRRKQAHHRAVQREITGVVAVIEGSIAETAVAADEGVER